MFSFRPYFLIPESATGGSRVALCNHRARGKFQGRKHNLIPRERRSPAFPREACRGQCMHRILRGNGLSFSPLPMCLTVGGRCSWQEFSSSRKRSCRPPGLRDDGVSSSLMPQTEHKPFPNLQDGEVCFSVLSAGPTLPAARLFSRVFPFSGGRGIASSASRTFFRNGPDGIRGFTYPYGSSPDRNHHDLSTTHVADSVQPFFFLSCGRIPRHFPRFQSVHFSLLWFG